MDIKFNILNRRFGITLYSRKIKKEWVTGYTNRTEDGLYIITLDYDNLDQDDVINDIRRLQYEFALSDFYVFNSGNGFHAVCLDKVTLLELRNIMENSSIDPNYMRVPFISGKRLWVLRLTNKDDKEVFYSGTIKSSYGKNRQSQAHAILLNNLFDLGIKLIYSDGEKHLKLASYPFS